MKTCKNARSALLRREEMAWRVVAGQTGRPEAGASFGAAAKTAVLWVGCFWDLGSAGCAGPRRGMSSRGSSSCAAARIAAATGVSPATADRVLKRAGLSRLRDPEPEGPARRYQHDRPGDMIHIDVKKPVRFDRPGH